jgi:hypothetical protein
MFVFKFSDGRYLKDMGSSTIPPKRRYDYWAALGTKDDWHKRYGPGGDYFEQFITAELHEAKTFITAKSVQSSNAYSWGGTIHEVEVTLRLK